MQDTILTRWSECYSAKLSDREQPDRVYCLVCIHPVGRLGQVIELGNHEFFVGRDQDCQLELLDDAVSRRHAVLRPTDEGIVVADLGSTNGTYVNDTQVSVRVLAPSDRLRFGNHIFKFLAPDRFEAEYFEAAYRMMTTDGLTQVYNRRYLLEAAQREVSRARRTGRSLSVLMIDVDRFKAINDRYGHLAGDAVLIELARRLRESLRGDEILSRYGGEEFCLLLPDSTLADAQAVGERIRTAVADSDFLTEHAHLEVTISVGVASTQHRVFNSAVELIAEADKLLYAAKQAGRNCVAS